MKLAMGLLQISTHQSYGNVQGESKPKVSERQFHDNDTVPAKKKAKKAEPKTSIGKYNLHGSHLNHQQELCRQQAHSWQLDADKHQTKAIIDAIHDKAFTTTATI
eukprot:scaffold7007_cov69-Cyclotella_meneghiniana.AAC.4